MKTPESNDTSVTCTTCANLRNGWCTQAKRAGFVPQRIELAAAFANLPQHCPAHAPRARAFETPTKTTA